MSLFIIIWDKNEVVVINARLFCPVSESGSKNPNGDGYGYGISLCSELEQYVTRTKSNQCDESNMLILVTYYFTGESLQLLLQVVHGRLLHKNHTCLHLFLFNISVIFVSSFYYS